MPYINCHLMDKLAPSRERDQAWKYAIVGPGAEMEKMKALSAGSQVELVSMCPATRYWQNKFEVLVTQLVQELNADGIYLN